MAKIIKNVYAMIFFVSLIFALNCNGKPYFLYIIIVYNILSLFINNILIFIISIVAYNECYEDEDCPNKMCKTYFVVKCINKKCQCIHDDDLKPFKTVDP